MSRDIVQSILAGSFAVAVILSSVFTFAAAIDAKLNMANRLVVEIDSGVSVLKTVRGNDAGSIEPNADVWLRDFFVDS